MPTILVVDDNYDIRTIMIEWLRDANYTVISAVNGLEALKMARQQHPDLILMDVMMPEMDGITACKNLRDDPATASTPVVLVTAREPSASRVEGLMAGATDYLMKPVDGDVLLARVRAILSRSETTPGQSERLLQETAYGALSILSCEFAWLLALDEEHEVLNSRAIAAAKGNHAAERFHQVFAKKGEALAIPYEQENNLIAQITANRVAEPVCTLDDLEFAGEVLLLKACRLLDVKTLCIASLITPDRTLGTLVLGFAGESEVESERGWQLLATVVGQAITALENAHLHQALKAQTVRLEKLVEERTDDVIRERERSTAIVEHAGEGIAFTDAEYQILFVNPAWESITGQSADDILNQTLTESLGGDEQTASLLDEIVPGKVLHRELKRQRPDGSAYSASLSITPIHEVDGRIANLVVIMRDITAQKEVEEMREQFVAKVSHELRTPLANLKLYHHLLQSGAPEKRDRYFTILSEQTIRLERIVEGLLDFSRFARAEWRFNPETFDLNALIKEVMGVHGPHVQAAELKLTLDLAPDLPSLVADRQRIEQLLVNLLTNAINYASPGDEIAIGTWPTPEKNSLTLRVRDTGMGIKPEELTFIFNRFYRSDQVMHVPGTGLGLSIVKEIVEMHGGTIAVDSQVGKGSTFTVYLPIKT